MMIDAQEGHFALMLFINKDCCNGNTGNWLRGIYWQ